MALSFRLMGEKAGVDPAQLALVLESIIIDAMVAKTLVEGNEAFYLVPSVISRIDAALMAVKSGMSVMVMTALKEGVDFIAQSEWEVPSGVDQTTGVDPVYGGSVPGGGGHGEAGNGPPTEGPGDGEPFR